MGKLQREAQINTTFLPYNLNLPGASVGYGNPPVVDKYGNTYGGTSGYLPNYGAGLTASAPGSGVAGNIGGGIAKYLNLGQSPTSGRVTSAGQLPNGSVNAGLSPDIAYLRNILMQGSGAALLQTLNGSNGIPAWLGNEFNTANANAPWIGSGPGIPQAMTNQLYGAASGYLNQATGAPPFDFNGTMAQQLALSRAYDAPAEQRGMMSNWDSQFGNGILNSTTGQYQTQALADAYNLKDIARQQNAFGQAMGLGSQYDARQAQQIQQALGLSGAGFEQGANQFGMGLQQNQLGSSNVMDRFQRAMALFGGGQQNQQTNANLAMGYLSGQQGIDQNLANLIALGGNLGMQRSGANAASYNFLMPKSPPSSGGGFMNSLMGGIGGTAGKAIGSTVGDMASTALSTIFSDARLKENIERVGVTDGGTPLYKYNYKWGGPTHIGVMAQEAPAKAVGLHESGYLTVDYSKVK